MFRYHKHAEKTAHLYRDIRVLSQRLKTYYFNLALSLRFISEFVIYYSLLLHGYIYFNANQHTPSDILLLFFGPPAQSRRREN